MIATIFGYITVLSFIGFFLGFLMFVGNLEETYKKFGLKLMIYCTILFIIGFGVCVYFPTKI